MNEGEWEVPYFILDHFIDLGWVLYSTAYPTSYPISPGVPGKGPVYAVSPAVHGLCNRNAKVHSEINVSICNGELIVDAFVSDNIFTCSLADPDCFKKLDEALL